LILSENQHVFVGSISSLQQDATVYFYTIKHLQIKHL